MHLGQHVVLSLPVRQCRGIYQSGTGFSQRECASMQRRPGSQHIINNDIAGVRVDSVPVGDHERARDILSALLAAEAGLGDSLMLFAEEKLSPAPGDMLGEDPGDSFSLIVSASKLPGGVQGNRHEHRPS